MASSGVGGASASTRNEVQSADTLGPSLRALWSAGDEVVPKEQQHHSQQQQDNRPQSQSQPQPQQQLQASVYEMSRDPRIGLSEDIDALASMKGQGGSSYLQNPVGSPSSTRMPPFGQLSNNGRASPSTHLRYSPQHSRLQHYTDDVGQDVGTSFVGPVKSISLARGVAPGLAESSANFDVPTALASPLAPRLINPHQSKPATSDRQHLRGASLQHSTGRGIAPSAMSISPAEPPPPMVESVVSALRPGSEDDQLFFHRDPANAVRRNHTIATDSRPAQRRLDQHFAQVSPNKNSLSAITGGMDGEDDLEAILRRRQSLLSPAADAEPNTRSSIWTATAPTNSLHRRYPSQPVSTMATSPVTELARSGPGSNSLSRDESTLHSSHNRSESAHLTRLDHGAFGSSPIALGSAFDNSAGSLLRRHQSLNYNLGRQAARNLVGASERGEQRSVFDKSASPLGASTSSSQAGPSSVAMQQTVSTSSFPESVFREPISPYQARPAGASGYDNDTQLAPSLMEAHARLARMSITSGIQNSATNNYHLTNASSAFAPSEHDHVENQRRLPALVTDRDVLARASKNTKLGGDTLPVSAAAYVPAIGHAHYRGDDRLDKAPGGRIRDGPQRDGPRSAYPGTGEWTANLGGQMMKLGANEDSSIASGSQPNVSPAIAVNDRVREGPSAHGKQHLQQRQDFFQQQQQYHLQQIQQLQQLQQAHAISQVGTQQYPYQMSPPIRLGTGTSQPQLASAFNAQWKPSTQGLPGAGPGPAASGLPVHAMRSSTGQSAPPPVPSGQMRRQMHPQGIAAETWELMATMGLNPAAPAFDVNPPNARFFVIKSYTEDDVFRSLKLGVWASTEKGNQRLDKAYKENSSVGPLYLFFSVNGSGHFCGIARMLTAVDFNADSSIWSEEGKWKGTFRVQWIYVKDIPNGALRHLRLTNTTECKPIVQSRDTQELPADGGRAALKIFADYPCRTTLLQDMSFYEEQARAKDQAHIDAAANAVHPSFRPPEEVGSQTFPPYPTPHRPSRGGRGKRNKGDANAAASDTSTSKRDILLP